MHYMKPHLPYDKQVKVLVARGLDVGTERDAVAVLRRIGYYRLSAYTDPMRRTGQDGKLNEFESGSTLADAVALHDFDHKLRLVLFGALQSLEIGLRTKVAYQLGKHGPMAHLEQESLDTNVCQTPAQGPDQEERTKFTIWREEYERQRKEARSEDYVKHFTLNYDGDVPVWAATEFLSMGSLVRLYGLMQSSDRKWIAHDLQVKSPEVLFGWLKALNVLRNHCAHGARIWNRKTTYPPTKVNPRMVERQLHHLQEVPNDRLYFLAACLAYMLSALHPDSRFVEDLRTTMRKVPSVPQLKPEQTMGFPEQWRSENLWQPGK